MEYPNFANLIQTIKALRDPKTGCPWDLEQDHKSLTKYLIEESYEYVHAVDSENSNKMRDELGDVLLQVVLNSQIANEANQFDIEDVAKAINDKMIERHPHVFNPSDEKINADEVLNRWVKSKAKKTKSFFNEEEVYLPSLIAANKIGHKSAQVNFDWENPMQVFDKVKEEMLEVSEEITKEKQDLNAIEDEIGDLLFSTAQLARHFNIDPEEALRKANLKFIKRFTKLEAHLKEKNLDIQKLSVPELEENWQEIKKK